MTRKFKKLSHSLYECKYHIVFCPKYRFRILKDEIGETVRQQNLQSEPVQGRSGGRRAEHPG